MIKITKRWRNHHANAKPEPYAGQSRNKFGALARALEAIHLVETRCHVRHPQEKLLTAIHDFARL